MERRLRRVLPGALLVCLATVLMPRPGLAQPRVVGDIPELGDMEVSAGLEMRDDGTGGDAVAGDGVHTARLTFEDVSTALTFSYVIVPAGGTLDDAIGLVPGFSGDAIPVVVALPASDEPVTIEFRYAESAGEDGFGPVPSIADSWNTGWSASPALRRDVPFVITAGFQDLFGTGGWDASSEVTLLRDDGAFGDRARADGVASLAVVSPVGLGDGAPGGWRAAVQTDEATVLGLHLSADGWADGTSGPGSDFTVEAARWMPVRFEVDLFRGMARVTEAPELLDLPMISQMSHRADAGGYVDVFNPTEAVLALEGIHLADDRRYHRIAEGLTGIRREDGANITGFDFNVKFPERAWIAPGATRTVNVTDNAETFESLHGFPPDYVVTTSPSEPHHMRLAYDQSVGSNASGRLTDGGEFLVLYGWEPGRPRVEDLDVLVWGNDTHLPPDKTGVTVDMETYGADAMTVSANRSIAGTAAEPGLWRYHFRRAGVQRLFACDAPCTLGDGTGYNGAFHMGHGGRYDATDQTLNDKVSRGGAVPSQVAVLSLAGTVEDESGDPIEGAAVVLRRGDEVHETTTVAGGTFDVDVPHGTWTLTASALGFRPTSRTVRVDHHKTLDAPVELEASTDVWHVSGVVTAEDTGAPIAGATVTATPGGESDTTDATGAYGLDLLEGAYALSVVAAGYRTATADIVVEDDLEFDFVLDEGAPPVVVSGRVESAEDDAPIAGATVVLDDGLGLVLTETTDGDGTFTFPEVPAETPYALSAAAPGFVSHLSDLEVEEDDVTDVLIRLTPTPGEWTISGVVVADDDGGAPIQGATVAIVEYGMVATTNAAGEFSLVGVDDGLHVLTAGAAGFVTTHEEVTVDGADVDGVVIALAPAIGDLVLSGTVTRADTGAPLAGAAVGVELPDGRVRSVATASDGTYVLAGLAAGTYDVTASALGFGAATETVTMSADAVLDFALTPGGDRRLVLSGTVALQDAAEEAWAGSTVTLEGAAERSVATGDGGAYIIGDLPAGSYTVRVDRAGYTTVEQTLDLDDDTALDFTLVPRDESEPEDPGCACSAGGAGGGGALPLLALAFAGLLRRRR